MKAKELELNEIEFILDPNTLPKETRAKKRNLPEVENLKRELEDLSNLYVEKDAGQSLVFLEKLSDKLSDKSSGLHSRLVHEMRIHLHRLKASLSVLRYRADKQKIRLGDSELLRVKDYYRKWGNKTRRW